MIHALPLADYHVYYNINVQPETRYDTEKKIITTPMILSLYTSALKYNIII